MRGSAIGSDDELFLMINVRGRSSGLPFNIWIGPRGQARHAARIRVQENHREQFDIDHLAAVSVEDDPPQIIEGHLSAADLDLVRRYIALNKGAVLDLWHEKIDGVELSRALKRINNWRTLLVGLVIGSLAVAAALVLLGGALGSLE